MEPEFRAAIEWLTGRKVLTFVQRQSHGRELFILDGPPERRNATA